MVLDVELRELREDIYDLTTLWERFEEVGDRPAWLERVISRMEDRKAKVVLTQRRMNDHPEVTDIDPVMSFPEIENLMKNLLRRGPG